MTEMGLMKHKVVIPDAVLEVIVDNTEPMVLEKICGLWCRGKRWVKKKVNKKFNKKISSATL